MRMLVAGVAIYLALLAGCGDVEEDLPSPRTTPLASPSLSPTQTAPSETADSTTTLTYVDPTYGFSFEYPESWHLSAPAGGAGAGGVFILYSYEPVVGLVEPMPPDYLKVEFVVLDNPQHLELEAWIEQAREAGSPIQILSSKSVTVDGIEGIVQVVDNGQGSWVQYFTPIADEIFLISQYPSDSLLMDDFTDLLSTFKFGLK